MTAEIYDRGYRRYDGERTGVSGAMSTLIRHSLRRSLGLGRPARFKLVPFLIILASIIPAIVFVGIAALIPSVIADEFIPSSPEYYGFIITALYLFAAFIAPDLLCNDRRSSMLGVYLASPLDRRSYLIAKAIAVAIMLGIVTIGPPLFLMIALTVQGSGPGGVGAVASETMQILLSGLMMAAVYTAVSFAVSASTDRSGTATAGTLAVLIGSTTVANVVVGNTDVSENVLLLSLLELPAQLAFRIHGETSEWSTEVTTLNMWLAVGGILLASTLWVWSRYGPLLVRR